jgi:predicted amidohydrolase
MTRSDSKSLLIKGGHLIDPAAKINAPMDMVLRDGRVAEIAVPNISAAAPMKSSTPAD